MRCDICGKENDCMEINFCKLCAFEFNYKTNKIKNDLAIYKKALELACKDRCDRCYTMVTRTCGYNKETYDCKSAEQFLQQAKEELEQNV